MDDARCLDVNVDYGHAFGYFLRIDVELPADALYDTHREDGGPMGWLGVSPDDADDLARRLTELAREVRSLLQEKHQPHAFDS